MGDGRGVCSSGGAGRWLGMGEGGRGGTGWDYSAYVIMRDITRLAEQ